ncbi:MAG: RNA-directed DNA polymerase, partial [bacterium]|nr:RNA-directed DNA polymerase [bacterium]
LTSQLFVNIYMNEFDQFVKTKLKERFYIRYADDFVIFNKNIEELQNLMPKIELFLKNQLKLSLHPHKIYLKTLSSGVDFLGWVNFFDHRVLRTSTKRRCMEKVSCGVDMQVYNSYMNLLKHGNTYKISKAIKAFYIPKKC